MASGTTSLALHWIGGVRVDGGDRQNSIDPATGETIGQYTLAGETQAQQAIEAARNAFETTTWKDEPLLRGRVLNAMAEAFERRTEDLARVLALENGKTLQQARFEISSVRRCLRFNGALAIAEFGRVMSVEPGHLSLVTREAVA